MTLYQKVIAAFGMLRSSIVQRAEKSTLAPTFSDSAEYAVGRLVYRNDTLYRCTVAHSGAWDSSHFTTTTIDEALSLKSEGGEGGGGGGGGEITLEDLYAKGPGDLFYKITVGVTNGIKTLDVEQTGVSSVSGVTPGDAYAKDASTGLYHKITVEDHNGTKTLALEQNGVTR